MSTTIKGYFLMIYSFCYRRKNFKYVPTYYRLSFAGILCLYRTALSRSWLRTERIQVGSN